MNNKEKKVYILQIAQADCGNARVGQSMILAAKTMREQSRTSYESTAIEEMIQSDTNHIDKGF